MFARPSKGLLGAFLLATQGSIALSACSSPSTTKSGFAFFTISVALLTLSRRACELEPLLEKLNMATRGLYPVILVQTSLELKAISANCWASGKGIIAQSENKNRPSSP